MSLKGTCTGNMLKSTNLHFLMNSVIITYHFSTVMSTSKVLDSGTSGSVLCISLHLTPLTPHINRSSSPIYSKYCGNLQSYHPFHPSLIQLSAGNPSYIHLCLYKLSNIPVLPFSSSLTAPSNSLSFCS